MLFPTIDFAVYFLVVFTGSWVLRPRPKAWRWFILLASCVFYLDLFSTRVTFLNLVVLGLTIGTASVASLVLRPVPEEEGQHVNPLVFVLPFLLFGAIGWVTHTLYAWYPGEADQNWRFLYLLLGIVLVNQTFARAVFAALGTGRARTSASRWLVRLGVAVNLAMLGFFKYWEFVREAFNLPLPILNLVLPLAISFFTFQAISYVVDVGRGELRPISTLDFAVYLTFFAHLVAGPIVRVGEFAPQLAAKADPRFVPASEAFMLVFRGMVKKVVVASYLAQIVDPVFDLPSSYAWWQVALAVYAYALQIYCDFSGYTDIAIGVALLLGIRFPQNFDAPYRSLSMQDFWRRWHMTLSRWLRDYLYIPLGGNRRGEARTYVNLFLTMVIGGFWHGANWTFLVWGAIHGGALVSERRVKELWAAREKPPILPPVLTKVLQWTLTFHVVVLAWVFFRARDFSNAFEVLGRLVSFADGIGTFPAISLAVVAALIVVFVASQFVPPEVPRRMSIAFGRVPPLFQIVAVAAALVVVDAFGPEGIAPFIYFRF